MLYLIRMKAFMSPWIIVFGSHCKQLTWWLQLRRQVALSGWSALFIEHHNLRDWRRQWGMTRLTGMRWIFGAVFAHSPILNSFMVTKSDEENSVQVSLCLLSASGNVKRLIKCDCPSDWADAFVVVEHISSSFVPGCPQIPSMDDGLFRTMCCIDSNIPCLRRRTSSTGLSKSRLWRLRQLQPDHKIIVRRYAWTSFDSSRWQSSSIHCYARLDHLQPLPLASLSSLPLLFLLSSHQLATYNFMRNGNQLHEQTTLRMLQASTSSLFWTIKMCLLRQNESSISE